LNDLGKYINKRIYELPIWMGIPMVGVFTSGASIPFEKFTLYLAALFFAMAHVLLINDWGGLRRNPRELSRYFGLDDSARFASMLGRAAIFCLLAGAILGLWLIPLNTLLLITVTGGFISVLYSHPDWHLKEHLVLSKLLHLAGGTIQFLLGYAVFSNNLAPGIAIGLFFGCIIMAGHFIHECGDFEEDLAHGIKTWATTNGVGKTAVFGMLTFVLAHIYLIALAVLQTLSWVDVAIFTPIVLLHLATLIILRGRYDSTSLLKRYRMQYRLSYVTACMVFVYAQIQNIDWVTFAINLNQVSGS